MNSTQLSVNLLTAADADALQVLAEELPIAELLGVAPGASGASVRRMIEAKLSERAEGKAHVSVIRFRSAVVGFVELRELYGSDGPWLTFAIGSAHRGLGYATFGVGMCAAFAFRNLGLPRIAADVEASNRAAMRVLEKSGFTRRDPVVLARNVDSSAERVSLQLTREQWLAHTQRPELTRLHPLLAAMLQVELSAGNEIAETGHGWPQPDSVFIKLKHRFRVKHETQANGIVYTEPKSPHWWFADYSVGNPVHVLACDSS